VLYSGGRYVTQCDDHVQLSALPGKLNKDGLLFQELNEGLAGVGGIAAAVLEKTGAQLAVQAL